jgi:Haem-binding domain
MANFLISEIMKRNVLLSFLIQVFLVCGFFLMSYPMRAQDVSKSPAALPDEVNKIVSVSCIPCHTSEGGLMSKTKLNFTVWNNYSPDKQKEKAAKMYSKLSKGEMPPKSAREKKPELIPTREQVEIIKKWSESFTVDTK